MGQRLLWKWKAVVSQTCFALPFVGGGSGCGHLHRYIILSGADKACPFVLSLFRN